MNRKMLSRLAPVVGSAIILVIIFWKNFSGDRKSGSRINWGNEAETSDSAGRAVAGVESHIASKRHDSASRDSVPIGDGWMLPTADHSLVTTAAQKAIDINDLFDQDMDAWAESSAWLDQPMGMDKKLAERMWECAENHLIAGHKDLCSNIVKVVVQDVGEGRGKVVYAEATLDESKHESPPGCAGYSECIASRGWMGAQGPFVSGINGSIYRGLSVKKSIRRRALTDEDRHFFKDQIVFMRKTADEAANGDDWSHPTNIHRAAMRKSTAQYLEWLLERDAEKDQ